MYLLSFCSSEIGRGDSNWRVVTRVARSYYTCTSLITLASRCNGCAEPETEGTSVIVISLLIMLSTANFMEKCQ